MSAAGAARSEMEATVGADRSAEMPEIAEVDAQQLGKARMFFCRSDYAAAQCGTRIHS